MKLKELKKGDFFTLKPHGEHHVSDSQVYIRGEYDKTEKKYDCGRYDDISYSRYFSGDKEVYTDFILPLMDFTQCLTLLENLWKWYFLIGKSRLDMKTNALMKYQRKSDHSAMLR